MEKYLQIGKIVNTHGFRGDIKMQSWSDSPKTVTLLKQMYRKQGDVYETLNVEKSSVHKDMVLVKFVGIDNFDSANMLREEVLYADRDDISKDEGAFFIADLIGLDVIDFENGKVYGKLCDVTQYGMHDIYTVKTEKNEVLIPAVSEFIKEINLDKGIFIKPIEGMFDEI